MKNYLLPVFALAVGALSLPPPAEAAKGGGFGMKLRSRLTIDVDLFPTAEGTPGSGGEVEIRVKQKDAVQQAMLKLSVDGIPAGAYSLDATITGGTALHLGNFTADGTAVASSGDDEGEDEASDFEMTLPAGLDARTIETITVSNTVGVVVLEGGTDTTVERESYFANVAVSGSGEGVHGHALLISKTEDDEEIDRKVLFIGFGAPADATLTINVNGVAAGTVISTEQGRVKFQELDAEIQLSSIQLITLSDASGAVIMQAQF